MIAALALAAWAQEAEPDSGLAAEGHRIEAVAGGTGASVSEKVVVGPDGGTHVLTLAARVRVGDVQIGAALPFASHRLPDGGRAGDLGNARLWAHYRLPWGGFEHHVGLRAHFGVGKNTWTWVNAADEVWPGAGLEAYWEARFGDEALTWMVRGAFGVHAARGFEPFPDTYARFLAAGGLDATLAGPLGIVAETSLQVWDPSPWEIAALLRVDPVSGLRLRAGAVAPVAVWAGAAPPDQPAGVREATILVDLTLAP